MVNEFLFGSARKCLLVLAALTLASSAWPDPLETPVETRLAPPYIVRHWQLQDGLPFDQVRCVLQRKNGFLWLGTLNGLSRFDGLEFENHSTRLNPELADNAIFSLYEDRKEILWIGHDTGQVSVRVGNRFKQIVIPDNWPEIPIAGFIQGSDGRVWAVNSNSDMLPVSLEKPGEPVFMGQPVVSIAVHSDKVLTAAAGTGRIIETIAGATLQRQVLVEMDPVIVAKAYPGNDGQTWVFSERHLKRLADGRLVSDYPILEQVNMTDSVLLESRNGTLYIGSLYHGLRIIRKDGREFQLNRDNELLHNHVYSIVEDREGTIWLGTGGGLTAIRESRLDASLTTDAWGKHSLRSIIPASDDGIWLGANNMGLYRIVSNRITRVEIDGMPSSVHAVAEDRAGNLWLSSWRLFLYLIDRHGGRWISPPAPSVTYISALHYCKEQKTLWAGGRHGLWRKQKGVWEDALPEHHDIRHVQCLENDGNGGLWIGMAQDGVAHLENGELVHYGVEQGLPCDNISSLCLDREQNILWIGTGSGGLAFLRDGRIQTVPAGRGLPGNIISQVLNGGGDRLWMVLKGGIAVVNKNELIDAVAHQEAEIRPILLDEADGVNINNLSEQRHGCMANDGRFYFSTDDSVVVIDPKRIERDEKPVEVQIKHLVCNGHVHFPQAGETILLPAGTRQVTVEYAGMSFIAPQLTQFRYRLKGMDDSRWSNIEASRQATFRNLDPGTYRFEIKARNRDGIWNNEPTSLEFSIRPYFHETTFFKVMLAASCLLLASLLTFLVVGRLSRKRLIRAEKLRAVEQERSRISMDIHDEVGAGLTRIVLLSDMAAADDAANESVKEMKRESGKLVRSLDEIVWMVTPGNDTLDALCDFLGKYAMDYLKGAGIRCVLDMPFNLPEWVVPGPVRHNLYLAVKETLNNIVKHSKASQVVLKIEVRTNQFCIMVCDNGKGVSEEADKRYHRGIDGMRQRMEQIGGRFEIASSHEGGTTATLMFHKNILEI